MCPIQACLTLCVVVATQLTEYLYPVNLGTRVFFEPGNPVLLNPVFISVYPVLLLPRDYKTKTSN